MPRTKRERRPGDDMTEKKLQGTVVELAQLTGWLCYHTYSSRRSEPGFPDLTLVRRDRVVFVELKTRTGRLRPAQIQWVEALRATAAEVYVWRPEHWFDGTIERCLR